MKKTNLFRGALFLMSSVFFFTLFTLSAQAGSYDVTLLSPSDGEIFEEAQDVTLEWKGSSPKYKVEVYYYTDYHTDYYTVTVFTQTVSETSLVVPKDKLNKNGKYGWRVTPCNDKGVPIVGYKPPSNVFYISRIGFVPVLLSPPNGVNISSPPIILDWTAPRKRVKGDFYELDINDYSSSYKYTVYSTSDFTLPSSLYKKGAGYRWKVRYCVSSDKCSEWSATSGFQISYNLTGDIVVNTLDSPKAKIEELNRRSECLRYQGYYSGSCYKAYAIDFQISYRYLGSAITLETAFSATSGYNIYLVDVLSGTRITPAAYDENYYLSVGREYQVILEKPEGEWLTLGGSLDSPPISWRDNAAADYEKMVSINPLYVRQFSVNTRVYSPQLGVAATDPSKAGLVSVEEVDNVGLFDIYKRGKDYFIKPLSAGGIGKIKVTVGDTFAYGTIDNMWFSNGTIKGTTRNLTFILTDNKAPVAVAEISRSGDSQRSKNISEVIKEASSSTNTSDLTNTSEHMKSNEDKGGGRIKTAVPTTVKVKINLYADKSYDPDDWTSEKGVSGNGECEWIIKNPLGREVSLGKIIKPSGPADCNKLDLGQTFYSAGIYTYILKITDNLGAVGTDQVTVDVSKGKDNLKVCIENCKNDINPFPLSLDRPLTILANTLSGVLKACYNLASGCTDDSGDVTNSADWRAIDQNKIEIVDEGTSEVKIKGKEEGKSQVDVKYNDEKTNFGVNVIASPPPSPPSEPSPGHFIEVSP